MFRSNSGGSGYRWEGHEMVHTGSSLILGSSPNNAENTQKLQYRGKLEELGFRQAPFSRHASEEELKKINNFRQHTYMSTSEVNLKLEENHLKPPGTEKVKTPENYAKRKSNSKMGEQEGFFKARGSGGKAPNPLKETSSTSNTEQILSHKSEKTFPSFIRSHAKSPGKFKAGKQGLCKENFKVIRRLGEGKFGCVYLAKEILTGMVVALKVVNKKRIVVDNFLGQFIRELKIQSFLDHPNIIKVLGYFHDEESFYTVLEVGCDGQLYDIIANGQTLNEESTSFIIGNLLDAVNLMHRYKILHRDIKPENIVLVHGNVKLCDFGWAVNKKEELRSTFCGTPLYLSPELIQGSKYDEKVDLWAIGVLAFEIYYGSSPFNIAEQADLYKIVTDDIEFPTHKKASKELREFITAILKKNPKDRLGSKELLAMEFIRRYRELETCEQLCQH